MRAAGGATQSINASNRISHPLYIKTVINHFRKATSRDQLEQYGAQFAAEIAKLNESDVPQDKAIYQTIKAAYRFEMGKFAHSSNKSA